MKGKATIFMAVIAAVMMSFATLADLEGNYAIDTKSSQVKWTGYHLAKSYEHYGFVTVKSGNVSFDEGRLKGGTVVIDMTSITNADVEKPKDNSKLVNHLKSEDFFDVANHPEARLVIRQAKEKSPGVFSTTADLTIRGITKPITFDTRITESGNGGFIATSKLRINRTDYKVMYGWSIENAMLDSEFELDVKIAGRKN